MSNSEGAGLKPKITQTESEPSSSTLLFLAESERRWLYTALLPIRIIRAKFNKCVNASNKALQNLIQDLIHKTFEFVHQWLPTENVCTRKQILSHSHQIWLWENIWFISTRWFFCFVFFGKVCGWHWCQYVYISFLQWLSAASSIDATRRAELTTETTMLSTNISIWKFDELICVSHIVACFSFQLPECVCSIIYCLSCSVCVWFVIPLCVQHRITNSLVVISQSIIKMKQLYTHAHIRHWNLPLSRIH